MIIGLFKELVDGRWMNYDPSKIYTIGSTVVVEDGKTYTVTEINGSKVTLEEVEDELE